MYKVIDLFAGAGGLSLGFSQTQKYEIKVAFENNPNMQETYKKNHPGVDVRGDVCSADYAEIQAQYGKIDVVIGGPPCQGFSNANRQKNHAISQNNMLVKQYIRAILELQPKAFVMENVSMLRSDVHRFYLNQADTPIVEKYGIHMEETEIPLLDASYVFSDALEIVKDADQIAKYLWDEDHYAALNVVYKAAKNPKKLISALTKHQKKLLKYAEAHPLQDITDPILYRDYQAFSALIEYYNGNLTSECLKPIIEPAVMIQRMLGKAKEIHENHLVVEKYNTEAGLCAVIKSYAVFDYIKGILGAEDNNYVIKADVLCAADYGAPQKRMRFVVMGIKRTIADDIKFPVGRFSDGHYRTVRDAIADLESVKTVTELIDDTGTPIEPVQDLGELGRSLRNTAVLKNHMITKTTDTAMARFKSLKQGENFHALKDELKTNTYTDVSRTQNTIYLRLNYDEPSGTVVNVRKSMWIHPTLDRAISVREAARLQTFPDSFVFCGSKDKQYQQVGNAVPPIMAKAIAKKLAAQLTEKLEEMENIHG